MTSSLPDAYFTMCWNMGTKEQGYQFTIQNSDFLN